MPLFSFPRAAVPVVGVAWAEAVPAVFANQLPVLGGVRLRGMQLAAVQRGGHLFAGVAIFDTVSGQESLIF